MSSLLEQARKSTYSLVTNRNANRSHDVSIDEEGAYSLHQGTDESEVGLPHKSKNITIGRPKIVKQLSSRQMSMRRQSTQEDFQVQNAIDESSHISIHSEAHYKQSIAPFSTLFCLVQCIILSLMLWQCGVAPMNINPMIGPYPDALNYWGAKNAVLIIEDGEVWRLVTPILLHAGVIHLLGNVLVQIESGNRWEKEWGSLIWMIVYLGSAIGSSILSTCVMPDQISVGSSGAVMGLFGGKFAEITLLCCEKSVTRAEWAGERSRKEQACEVIGGIVLVMAMSFIPFVDWAAHLGGLIAGFVIGLVCFSFKFRNWFFILIWFIVGVGSTVAIFSGALAYMYSEVETKDDLRDVCGYYKQFFDSYECRCMLDEANGERD